MATTNPSAQPPRAKQTPAYRPQPPTDKNNRTVFLDFNQAPEEIVRIMDEAKGQAAQFTTQNGRLRKNLRWLYPLGLLFVLLDYVLGYNYYTFTLVCAGVWVIAFASLRLVKRQGAAPDFGAKFELARTIMDTLEDDVPDNRTLMGWLDLTGFDQESKQYRQKKSTSGRPIVYYRDEWLRMKAKMYDSNVMRVSVVEKVKDRKGFYKRGMSGKMKWKVGSTYKQHALNISISVNPEAYTVTPFDYNKVAIPDSRFAIEAALAENGRITLKASTNKEYDAWDVLHAMKYSYQHIQPISVIGNP
jgi:hypothetical protein